jgi:hypothetical protein
MAGGERAAIQLPGAWAMRLGCDALEDAKQTVEVMGRTFPTVSSAPRTCSFTIPTSWKSAVAFNDRSISTVVPPAAPCTDSRARESETDSKRRGGDRGRSPKRVRRAPTTTQYGVLLTIRSGGC